MKNLSSMKKYEQVSDAKPVA